MEEKNKIKQNNEIVYKDINYNDAIRIDNILKGVLLIIIILSGNYLGQMLGCNLQILFTTDIVSKNMILFFTIYFTLSLFSDEPTHPLEHLKYSIILFVIFKIFTRMQREYTFLCILTLTFITIAEHYKNYLKYNKQFEKYDDIFSKQMNLISFFIIILIIGHIRYLKIKYLEYGENFNIFEFYFHRQTCKSLKNLKLSY